MSRYPGRAKAMAIIAAVTLLATCMGIMQPPGRSDPGVSRPSPD